MSASESLPGVSLPAEERFHRRYYRAVRMLRSAMLLLLIAVGLGVVGTGPLSWADARDGDLHVSYERFARAGAPWVLEVEVPAPSDGAVHVVIDRRFHDGQQLDAVVPQPTSVTISDDVVTYVFEAESSSGQVKAAFWFTADALWRQHAQVGIAGGGPRVAFDQFVYP